MAAPAENSSVNRILRPLLTDEQKELGARLINEGLLDKQQFLERYGRGERFEEAISSSWRGRASGSFTVFLRELAGAPATFQQAISLAKNEPVEFGKQLVVGTFQAAGSGLTEAAKALTTGEAPEDPIQTLSNLLIIPSAVATGGGALGLVGSTALRSSRIATATAPLRAAVEGGRHIGKTARAIGKTTRGASRIAFLTGTAADLLDPEGGPAGIFLGLFGDVAFTLLPAVNASRRSRGEPEIDEPTPGELRGIDTGPHPSGEGGVEFTREISNESAVPLIQRANVLLERARNAGRDEIVIGLEVFIDGLPAGVELGFPFPQDLSARMDEYFRRVEESLDSRTTNAEEPAAQPVDAPPAAPPTPDVEPRPQPAGEVDFGSPNPIRNEFYISRKDGGWQAVERATRVTFEGVPGEFFAHRADSGWRISDSRSGASIESRAPTRREAISSAEFKIKETVGVDEFVRIRENAIQTIGEVSPRFRPETEAASASETPTVAADPVADTRPQPEPTPRADEPSPPVEETPAPRVEEPSPPVEETPAPRVEEPAAQPATAAQPDKFFAHRGGRFVEVEGEPVDIPGLEGDFFITRNADEFMLIEGRTGTSIARSPTAEGLQNKIERLGRDVTQDRFNDNIRNTLRQTQALSPRHTGEDLPAPLAGVDDPVVGTIELRQPGVLNRRFAEVTGVVYRGGKDKRLRVRVDNPGGEIPKFVDLDSRFRTRTERDQSRAAFEQALQAQEQRAGAAVAEGTLDALLASRDSLRVTREGLDADDVGRDFARDAQARVDALINDVVQPAINRAQDAAGDAERTDAENAVVRGGEVVEDLDGFRVTSTADGRHFATDRDGNAISEPGSLDDARRAAAEALFVASGPPEPRLAAEIEKALSAGSLTRDELFRLADRAFAGTQAEGAYTAKRAFDIAEVAVNAHILNSRPDLSPTDGDIRVTLEQSRGLLEFEENLPRQNRRTVEQVEFQQFSTPHHYAHAIAWLANIKPDDFVLEPSAGTGNLATFAKRAHGDDVTVAVNELAPDRMELLERLPFDHFTAEDARQLNAILTPDIAPTVVLMNPPFSATAGRTRGRKNLLEGAEHVREALDRLEDGGRLVAIVGGGREATGGMAFGAATFRSWWDGVFADFDVKANVRVGGDVYKRFGTTFATRVLVIDKTGPTADRASVVGGEVETVAELIETLEEVRNGRGTMGGEPPPNQPNGEALVEGGQGGRGPGSLIHAAVDGVGARASREAEARSEAPGTRRRRGGGVAADQPGPGALEDDGRTGGVGSGSVSEERRPGGAEPDAGGARAPVEREGRGAGADAGAVADITEAETVTRRVAAAGEELSDKTFSRYAPSVLVSGSKPHRAALAESAAMASVPYPNVTYRPKLPRAVIESGAISDVQLEPIALAGAAHSQHNRDGTRRGFYTGDGTGVGKAREIAGVIMDNENNGRRKSVWITEKIGLLKDAKREYAAVGGDPNRVFSVSPIKDDISVSEGIAFITYNTLKYEGKGLNRLDQLSKWLGDDFEGVIAFDESHNMGNLMEAGVGPETGKGGTTGSDQAIAGDALRRRFPQARTFYASATGATEVANMAYLANLGLWGEGTAFPSATNFISEIDRAGVAAMELVARDMKALGVYTARTLSTDGVTYDRIEHKLTAEQIDIYDRYAEAWRTILSNLNAVLAATGADASPQARKNANSAFWGAQQRFFNALITSMQMPEVLADMREKFDKGHAVVAQLTNTNESALDAALSAGGDAPDFDLIDTSSRETLMGYLANSFPTARYEEYVDENGNRRSRPVTDSAGNPVEDPQAIAVRDEALAMVGSLPPVQGALDQIIDEFGVENVAEVTGRGKRIVTVDGELKLQSLSPLAREADADAFMADKKRVLVFSEAGGTGRGYHSDLEAKNQRKRFHYLVQPGWRADKAIQGFGRTHRTNQASQPHYQLASTNLPGHKRFMSSIARRLDQIASLTRGQRDASGQSLIDAEMNLETDLAKNALENLFRDIHQGVIEGMDLATVEDAMGLSVRTETGGFSARNVPKVTRFLNRLLTLPVAEQGRMFDAFFERLIDTTDAARERGELDQGIQTLRALKIEKVSDEVVFQMKEGPETRMVKLAVTHPVERTDFAAADEMGRRRNGTYVRNRASGRVYLVMDAGSGTRRDGGVFQRTRRVGPTSNQVMDAADLNLRERYDTLTDDEAAAAWREEFDAAPETVTREEHFIVGAILPIWDRLRGSTEVIRTQTDEGEPLIGRRVAKEDLAAVLKNLGAAPDKVDIPASDVLNRAMDANEELRLSNDWRLRSATVGGEARLELTGPDHRHLQEMRNAGLFTEIIGSKTRFFVPLGPQAEAIIGGILETRPVVEATERGAGIQGAGRATVVPRRGEAEVPSQSDAVSAENIEVANVVSSFRETRLRTPASEMRGYLNVNDQPLMADRNFGWTDGNLTVLVPLNTILNPLEVRDLDNRGRLNPLPVDADARTVAEFMEPSIANGDVVRVIGEVDIAGSRQAALSDPHGEIILLESARFRALASLRETAQLRSSGFNVVGALDGQGRLVGMMKKTEATISDAVKRALTKIVAIRENGNLAGWLRRAQSATVDDLRNFLNDESGSIMFAPDWINKLSARDAAEWMRHAWGAAWLNPISHQVIQTGWTTLRRMGGEAGRIADILEHDIRHKGEARAGAFHAELRDWERRLRKESAPIVRRWIREGVVPRAAPLLNDPLGERVAWRRLFRHISQSHEGKVRPGTPLIAEIIEGVKRHNDTVGDEIMGMNVEAMGNGVVGRFNLGLMDLLPTDNGPGGLARQMSEELRAAFAAQGRQFSERAHIERKGVTGGVSEWEILDGDQRLTARIYEADNARYDPFKGQVLLYDSRRMGDLIFIYDNDTPSRLWEPIENYFPHYVNWRKINPDSKPGTKAHLRWQSYVRKFASSNGMSEYDAAQWLRRRRNSIRTRQDGHLEQERHNYPDYSTNYFEVWTAHAYTGMKRLETIRAFGQKSGDAVGRRLNRMFTPQNRYERAVWKLRRSAGYPDINPDASTFFTERPFILNNDETTRAFIDPEAHRNISPAEWKELVDRDVLKRVRRKSDGRVGYIAENLSELEAPGWLPGHIAETVQRRAVAADIINRQMGWTDKNVFEQELEGWVSAIRSANVLTFMGRAWISNAFQSANTVARVGLLKTGRGLFDFVRSIDDRDWAYSIGAILDDWSVWYGDNAASAEVMLEGLTPFSQVERMNRTVAALSGRWYMNAALKKIVADPANPALRRRITEIAGDYRKDFSDPRIEAKLEKALQTPWTKEQINLATRLQMRDMPAELRPLADVIHLGAKIIADTTQHRVEPIDLARAFTSSPVGKLVTQFQSFQAKQTQFMKNTVKRDLRLWRDGHGLGLAVAGAAGFVGLGATAFLLRKTLSGKEIEDKDLTIFNFLNATAAFGIVGDLAESRNFRGAVAQRMLGPTLGTAAQIVEQGPVRPVSRLIRPPLVGPSLADLLKEDKEASIPVRRGGLSGAAQRLNRQE